MIYCYTGVPGSGKSLHAANDIRFALNHKRPVIANFELGMDAPVKYRDLFRYIPNEKLSPELLVSIADEYWLSGARPFREDYLLFVADECQLLWNSRRWSDKARMSWLEFLSQHRKYGYKLIMIAQSAKMVDNQFRMLFDTEINHRKLSSMGAIGYILSRPFGDRLFMRVSYLFQTGERLGSDWSIGMKKDMQMYDSYSRLRQLEYSST